MQRKIAIVACILLLGGLDIINVFREEGEVKDGSVEVCLIA